MKTQALKLAASLLLIAAAAYSADVVLKADDKDGRDDVWEKRYDSGKNTWGIKGTGDPLSGSMWFNSFPGTTGEYRVKLGIVAECDGQPKYKVSAGGTVLKSGSYPWGSGTRCTKSTNPDVIDCGIHTIRNGDKIEIWGRSVYPCGSHGAYTRWYELRFIPQGGTVEPPPSGTPTKLLDPAEGLDLVEGRTYTLEGEGDNLSWSYDANSDGLGSVPIGSGATADLAIPTDIKSPKTLTLTLEGDNGVVSREFQIVAPQPLVTITSPDDNQILTEGEQIVVEWEADTNWVTDVDIKVSTDGGRTWSKLNARSVSLSDEQWSNFAWTVPSSAVSTNAKLRVEKYEAGSQEERDDIGIEIHAAASAAMPLQQHSSDTRRVTISRKNGAVNIGIPVTGAYTAELINMQGATVARLSGTGPAAHSYARGELSPGLYLLRLRFAAGSATAVPFIMP